MPLTAAVLSIELISNFEEFFAKKKSTKRYFISFKNEGLTAEYQLFLQQMNKGQPHAKQLDQQRNHFPHTLPSLSGKMFTTVKLTSNFDLSSGYSCNSSVSPRFFSVSIVSVPQGKL